MKLHPLDKIVTPWAILLVQFSDQTDTWPIKTINDVFTSAGSDNLNIVDYFNEMSHNKVDLSGSKVFGPYRLKEKLSDYKGRPNGRDWLKDLAIKKATDANVPLNNFSGVCVCSFAPGELGGWLGGMAAICDTANLSPSLLGQEMRHGYGIDDARINGSTVDYQDPWEVQIVFNAYMAPHTEFKNAWEIRARGWFDESRVFFPSSPSAIDVVKLRPLHRTDLTGIFAAQVGPYLVEFRVWQRWDAGIPRACDLVHRFQDDHSYLMPSISGNKDCIVGDKFEIGDSSKTSTDYYAVEVLDIDESNLTATIRIHQRIARC